jgi:hypothetical protein
MLLSMQFAKNVIWIEFTHKIDFYSSFEYILKSFNVNIYHQFKYYNTKDANNTF